jgi:ATP-dependent DNA helicase RecG
LFWSDGMTREELIALLQKYEWRTVEFKNAQGGVPADAYKTVSAFANTEGGHLVFGVQDTRGSFEIVGVLDVDRTQNDFLTSIRSSQKFNHIVSVAEDAFGFDGKTLLVFYIDEARRQDKPVYLNGDIRQSYIRRGSGDQKCSPAEIERFLRDAAGSTYDREALSDLDAESFFDAPSVAWYRRVFQEKNANRYAELSDVEFLNEFGFVVENNGSLRPTRAAALLFGQERILRAMLPRGIVDYQRVDQSFANWSPELRWSDRAVLEGNLIQAWQALVEKYSRLADRPFSLDAATMRRHDEAPDYTSFREAAINLLIHQDFGDQTRKPVIKIFTDRSIFWNPGDAFATVDKLLEPVEKEVRNPAIVAAFRRIGLSDQAGTGIRSIFGKWRDLGFVPPQITNDKGEKTFEVVLLREKLFTEAQRLFQAQLGVTLSEREAAVFAYACRQGKLDLTDAKAVLGRGESESLAVLERLVTQRLLAELEPKIRWGLAQHLQARFAPGDTPSGIAANLPTEQPAATPQSLPTDQAASEQTSSLVTDQASVQTPNLVTPTLTNLTDVQKQILLLCEMPRSQQELMRIQGMSHRDFFRRTRLMPLLQAGLLRMTHPEEPNHPGQAYVVSETALPLLAEWRASADLSTDQVDATQPNLSTPSSGQVRHNEDEHE